MNGSCSWETMDIEKGVERGIVVDLNANADRLSTIRFEFQVKGEHVPRVYFVPSDADELLSFLFDKAPTHTIEHAFRHRMDNNRAIRGYSFYVVPSPVETNITSEFIDAITRFGK